MFDAWRTRARAVLAAGLRRAAAASTAIALGGAALVGASAATAAPAATAPGAPAAPPASGALGPAAGQLFDEPVEGELAVAVVLEGGGVVEPGDDVLGTIVIANGTDDETAAGTVSLTVGDAPLAGRDALDAWYLGGTGAHEVLRMSAPALLPGESRELPFSVPASALPFEADAPFGARGAAVSWRANGAPPATGRASLVWSAPASGALDLSVVVPITAPIDDPALLPLSRLAELTAPEGGLTRLLDAVDGRGVTLAIDPRLLVSIRALGTAAPASSVAWLERLESLDNPSFALEFADASLVLQAQAGLDAPLEPAEFRFVTDAQEFDEAGTAQPEPDDAAPTGTGPNGDDPAASDPATADPATADPTTGEPTGPGDDGDDPADDAPSREELLAVDASRADLVWPSPGIVGDADLERIAEWRPGAAVLLAGEQVRSATAPSGGAGQSCAPQQRIGGAAVLITDPALDRALADAATAVGSLGADDALGRAAALAAATASTAQSGCALIATLPRIPLDDPERLAAVLELVDGLGPVDLAPLPAAADPASLPSAALVPAENELDRAERFAELVELESQGLELTGLYANPEGADDELRVRLLVLASASWIDLDDAPRQWRAAADRYADFAVGARTAIRVVSGSEIQLIGQQTALPVFIHNDSDRRVSVVVRARPTTGHLDIPEAVTVVVEPNSNVRAQLPAEAIANGLTTVIVTLTTPDGTALPAAAQLSVNINAQLEIVLLAIIGGAVLVLLAVGTVRMIRRRERARGRARLRAEMAESSAPDEDAAAPAGSEPAGAEPGEPERDPAPASDPTPASGTTHDPRTD
ncbi:MAG: hypothetical protein GXX90_07550 [Microbacteriaceae bacterium]|nr:hypothetical protein [Microbacteriaceae bacterium]